MIKFRPYYAQSTTTQEEFEKATIELYHAMLKQRLLPVSPLIQCEAGRAKTIKAFSSPGTQNGRRVIKVYKRSFWICVRGNSGREIT